MSQTDEDAEMPYDPSDDEVLSDVLTAAEARLMSLPGVTGVGLGQTETGNDALTVYLQSAGAAARLPKTFEGLPVVTEVTGDIVAD